jgi:hypothetical protein
MEPGRASAAFVRCGIPALIAATLLGACGGSVTGTDDAGHAATDDATEEDSGADALMCPPGSALPDANVYQCEAGPPGSAGCQALSGDPDAVYPAGCSLERTIRGGFCAGPCCGPLACTCQPFPGPNGAMSLQFVCPD